MNTHTHSHTHATEETPEVVGRRGFFISVLEWTGFGLTAGFLGKNLIKYLLPPIQEAVSRKVYISSLSQIPVGEMFKTQDLKGKPVAILRAEGNAVTAFSLTCTHLGCQVHWQAKEQNFLCPCHTAVFDKNGKVVSGPPPAPLMQFEVLVENDNVFLKFPEV